MRTRHRSGPADEAIGRLVDWLTRHGALSSGEAMALLEAQPGVEGASAFDLAYVPSASTR